MFVTEYPTMLSVSLLSVIPKIGNLRLLSNYRGIEMQPLLSDLYDKTLSNRLLQWVKISPEQTAFQKGKGTINQIFLLRLIMGLAKYYNTPLYVGFFDLSKAFYAKKMSINMKKSGYMIINAKDGDIKSDIKLEDQWIPYKSEKKYLGATFTNTGIVKEDVNLLVKEKSKDMIVKLLNFIYNNKYAPVSVKLKVVKACVNASVIHSCES